MKMKNISIIAALACCISLTGCYSYQTVRPEDKQSALDSNNTDIRITTVDSTVIEAESRHYIAVHEPADFTLARGAVQDRNSGTMMPFSGLVRPGRPVRIDTNGRIDEYHSKRGLVYCLATEDGAPVRAMEEDVLFVKKSDGTGIWCMGKVAEGQGKGSVFRGRIPFESIRIIDRAIFSEWKTIGVAILSAGCAAGIGWAFLAATVKISGVFGNVK